MGTREYTIDKLERSPDGYWQARITAGDTTTVDVHRKHGSWIGERRSAPHSRKMQSFHVLPDIAAALQEKVRKRERRGE